MHILIGLLSSLVTILWLLDRLGIDLGGLNPWAWRRRRHWRKKYTANPVFSIDSPMQTTALLVVATAKADGDMSAQEKQAIQAMFESTFQLSPKDASGLFLASSHLLGTGEEVRAQLKRVIDPSRDKFTDEQARSAVELLEQIAALGGGASELQRDFVGEARALLVRESPQPGAWQ
ncbi:MAG: TerB family tellurite resistance protein [Pseudomonadota bacterium]